MRRSGAALVAALSALAAVPGLAGANQRQESVFQDDNLLLYRGDRVSDRTFDELRVSSKSRDDLQTVIALLKGKDFDFALQFVNYR